MSELTSVAIQENIFSPLARIRRDVHAGFREKSDAILCKCCGDARCRGHLPGAEICSIAAADFGRFYQALGATSFAAVVLAPHFDAQKAVKERVITGCGGLHAKSTNVPTGLTGLDGYLDNVVPSADPARNAIASMKMLARQHGTQTYMATLQDHRTGRLYPIGISKGGHYIEIENAGREIGSDAREAISTISIGRIGELDQKLALYLENNWKRATDLEDGSSGLVESLAVQNPKIILATDSINPTDTIFPSFSNPGEVFRISIHRNPQREGLTRNGVNNALKQLQYPFHNIDKGYFTTRLLVIHVKNFEDAEQFFVDFKRDPVLSTFRNNGGEVLLVSTNQGAPEKTQLFTAGTW